MNSFSASLNIYYASNFSAYLTYNITISDSGKLSLATLKACSHLDYLLYISKQSTGNPAFKKYFSAISYYLTSE